MDWMEQERERGITIHVCRDDVLLEGDGQELPRASHQHHRHPGHVDFTIEVERSMRVLDGARMVSARWAACSRNPRRCGVRPTSTRCRVSRFVNKMDRTGADFFKVYDQMKIRLGQTLYRCKFQSALKKTSGIIDLVRMKAIFWDEASQGMKYEAREIPDDLKAKAEEWRSKMVESAAEANEELMNKVSRNRGS